jgi:hypothetical protein
MQLLRFLPMKLRPHAAFDTDELLVALWIGQCPINETDPFE